MKSLLELAKFTFLELIPIIIGKILLVFFWRNNLLLAFLYVIVIAAAFTIKYEKREIWIFLLGAFAGLFIELWAVGVVGFQTFAEGALWNIPLWMP